MEIKIRYPFDIPPQEAILLQRKLARRLILQDDFSKIETIAGCDVTYSKEGNRCRGIVVIFSFPDMKILKYEEREEMVSYPYIPGLLSFREAPVLLKILEGIDDVDLLIFDGHGIAHPRRLGLASHLGVVLDKPAIGCAKSPLAGNFTQPPSQQGSYSYVRKRGKIIGVALRTKEKVKPVFVSPGHRVSLPTSIEIILSTVKGYRQPEVTRIPHKLLTNTKNKTLMLIDGTKEIRDL
ncbi:MAG TPA: endonuclease V [Candidatus Omnitrophica bacterium]|nr:endonuclease V [Candidatus Omnitrophota bacterium]